jgi:hypothetical protein
VQSERHPSYVDQRVEAFLAKMEVSGFLEWSIINCSALRALAVWLSLLCEERYDKSYFVPYIKVVKFNLKVYESINCNQIQLSFNTYKHSYSAEL